jgi:rod shape-determining protein MreC
MRKRYIFFLLLIVLVLSPFIYTPSKNLFLFISSPFLVVLEKTGSVFENFFATIRSIKDLTKEVEEREIEVRKLQSEKAELIEKEKENEVLKRQLGFLESNKNLNLLPAYVIGRAPNSFLQYLIVNKGERDGVLKGQIVVSEGILLGKIEEVNLSTSKVFLITNPTQAVPASTQESRASGLVRGELGYGLILEDLPKEIPLSVGENVITSGLGGDFPKGFLIGQIEKVISSPADLFQKASLKPFLDYSKLEIVFIIKNE